MIGCVSLNMRDAVELMSSSRQLSVEIDLTDNVFVAVGEDSAKAVFPRSIRVYEEANQLGLSIPEATVMIFDIRRAARDFVGETDDARSAVSFLSRWRTGGRTR